MAANMNDTSKELCQVCRDSKLFKKVLACVEIQLLCRWFLLFLCARIDSRKWYIGLIIFHNIKISLEKKTLSKSKPNDVKKYSLKENIRKLLSNGVFIKF